MFSAGIVLSGSTANAYQLEQHFCRRSLLYHSSKVSVFFRIRPRSIFCNCLCYTGELSQSHASPRQQKSGYAAHFSQVLEVSERRDSKASNVNEPLLY